MGSEGRGSRLSVSRLTGLGGVSSGRGLGLNAPAERVITPISGERSGTGRVDGVSGPSGQPTLTIPGPSSGGLTVGPGLLKPATGPIRRGPGPRRSKTQGIGGLPGGTVLLNLVHQPSPARPPTVGLPRSLTQADCPPVSSVGHGGSRLAGSVQRDSGIPIPGATTAVSGLEEPGFGPGRVLGLPNSPVSPNGVGLPGSGLRQDSGLLREVSVSRGDRFLIGLKGPNSDDPVGRPVVGGPVSPPFRGEQRGGLVGFGRGPISGPMTCVSREPEPGISSGFSIQGLV